MSDELLATWTLGPMAEDAYIGPTEWADLWKLMEQSAGPGGLKLAPGETLTLTLVGHRHADEGAQP